jgi:aminopeptidase N
MRDSFAMDNGRHYESKKAFLKLSRAGVLLILAIFTCCLVAVALLVYNFAVCPQEDPRISENHYHSLDPSHPLSVSMSTSENDPTLLPRELLRLPRSVKPVSYDVTLLPFLATENFTFSGEAAITIHIAEACRNVTLHSYMLQITWSSSQIQKLDDEGKPLENVSIHNQYFVEEKQFLVLETSKELEKGADYVVKLRFVGSIKDNLQGFYKSSYNVGAETKWIASTQFQATDARR